MWWFLYLLGEIKLEKRFGSSWLGYLILWGMVNKYICFFLYLLFGFKLC